MSVSLANAGNKSGFYLDHCAGCGSRLAEGEGHSEEVDGFGTKRWDDGCYKARAEYLSMTLASEDERFDKRRKYRPQQCTVFEVGASGYDDHNSFFEGMTEYEFLGDVGDKS